MTGRRIARRCGAGRSAARTSQVGPIQSSEVAMGRSILSVQQRPPPHQDGNWPSPLHRGRICAPAARGTQRRWKSKTAAPAPSKSRGLSPRPAFGSNHIPVSGGNRVGVTRQKIAIAPSALGYSELVCTTGSAGLPVPRQEHPYAPELFSSHPPGLDQASAISFGGAISTFV